MQNIIEILKNLSIEVPEEKQSDLNKAVSENYKTIVEVEKKISKLEADRDNWKTQAETATETLKGFEGKDFDAMQKEIDTWKLKADEAEKTYNAKLAEREKNDLLKEKMTLLESDITSPLARQAIFDEISKSITVKDGALIGFDDLYAKAKETHPTEFRNKEQEELEQNKAKFTEPMKNTNSQVTKEAIMQIKDKAERQQAMLENRSLFGI